MNTKTLLHNKCQELLEKRHEVIQTSIDDIQTALQSETKSSAGDKHETGRAMLQLEREKTGNQLSEIEKQIEILKKIKPESKHQKVAFGSVVKTTRANYFIAVSVGEIEVESTNYFAISTQTPIAQILLSKKVGDNVCFRESEFKILEII